MYFSSLIIESVRAQKKVVELKMPCIKNGFQQDSRRMNWPTNSIEALSKRWQCKQRHYISRKDLTIILTQLSNCGAILIQCAHSRKIGPKVN